MTEFQTLQVRTSLRWMAPMNEKLTDCFYHGLFLINPQMCDILTHDKVDRRHGFWPAVLVAVEHANQEQLLIEFKALAQLYIKLGVQSKHLKDGQAALLWTLEKVLDSKFTPDLRQAWSVLTAEGIAIITPMLHAHEFSVKTIAFQVPDPPQRPTKVPSSTAHRPSFLSRFASYF